MPTDNLRVRDIRTLPFFWIQRSLLDVIRPSWKGILAYNALAYYATGESATCKDIGLNMLADRVSVSEDTMRRGLEELVKKKAVRLKPRYRKITNGHRQQLPNEYVLIDLATPKEQPI